MKKIITLVLIVFTLSNCSNDDDNSPNPEIVGEWKLIQAKIINSETNTTVDYSAENIIYNFQENGTLSVIGGQNFGYPTGEYDYVFGEDYLGSENSGGQMILLVKIGITKWTYKLENGQMTIGSSYVDGPDLIFERD
jgi:hypothetical protein